MDKKFLIKKISDKNIDNEILNIGFDKDYIDVAKNKYHSAVYKIYSLTPVQATILKQTALTCGTDCAVHREVLTHNIDSTDVILSATNAQLKKIIQKLYIQPFGLKTLADNLKEVNSTLNSFTIRNKEFSWDKTYIMGILNCTPNSFSENGENFNTQNALNSFATMISDGADIIDIGAESTAPMNTKITVEEELKRLEKVLVQCREKNSDIPISLDTRNAKTAEFGLMNGVDIINDVSGLCYDEKMAEIISKYNSYVVLTFDDEIKDNTLDETIKGLLSRVGKATNAGISKEKIILDVGLGFNKTYEQNFELIKYADEICSLNFPVLYGLSRKSFVQKVTNKEAKETLPANIALASYLANKGVNILRVHDVLEHKIAFQALDKVIYD